jgi:hypothetical protein
MEDEPHDAVKLLIARMDSHPEEFKLKDPSYHDRWYNHISAINSYGNEADVAALNAKIRDIRMAEVHERIMEELCNGPENRRKEEEDAEYERHLAASLKHAQIQQQNNQLQSYGQALGSYQNQASAIGLVGRSLTSTLMDEYVNNGTINAAKIEPTLSSSAINQIKKALKL